MKWIDSEIDLTHGTPRLRSKTQVEYVFSKMTTLRFFKYQKKDLSKKRMPYCKEG